MCKTNENYVYKTGSEKPFRRYDEMADKECTHILLIHVDFHRFTEMKIFGIEHLNYH